MAKVTLDFTNAEDGFKLVPEGEYICKVTKVEVKQGSKAKYFNWELTVGLGEYKGSKLFEITSLSVDALWRLRGFLQSCGIEVPRSKFNVDTDLVVGKIVGVTVVHSEYVKDGQKKISAKPAETFRVAKGASGWQRVNTEAAADDEDETEVDVSSPEVDLDMDDAIVPDEIEI